MPAPSPLAIATQSVQRLVKEESYYRKELAQQSERVKKLEAELQASPDSADGNATFMLKQEVRLFPLPLLLPLTPPPPLFTTRNTLPTLLYPIFPRVWRAPLFKPTNGTENGTL